MSFLFSQQLFKATTGFLLLNNNSYEQKELFHQQLSREEIEYIEQFQRNSHPSSYSEERRTIYDWWHRGLEPWERQLLFENGYNDKIGCFSSEELKSAIERLLIEKSPGKPTEKDGFIPKKDWDGKTVKAPNSKRRGYPDKDGNVWVPTGQGRGVHEPHWDVEFKKPDSEGRNHKNVYPKGNVRYRK